MTFECPLFERERRHAIYHAYIHSFLKVTSNGYVVTGSRQYSDYIVYIFLFLSLECSYACAIAQAETLEAPCFFNIFANVFTVEPVVMTSSIMAICSPEIFLQ